MLAVSDDKLPDAREEAEQVAGLLLSTTGRLQITSETGAATTKNALLAAKNDAVLHVAAHGTLGMDGAALELADRQVPALEISALQVAPALAVLSACDAAAERAERGPPTRHAHLVADLHRVCRRLGLRLGMASGHPEAAARFVADNERVHWHDQAVWWVRQKRDTAAAAVSDWEALREAAAGIKRHALSRLAEYLEQFEHNATALGAHVHWARDAAEHNAIVHRLLEDRGVTRLVKSKSMLTEECKLNPYLEARGIEVIDTDLGERIVQLAKEPPSHIVMPAIHRRKEEIGELFQIHLRTKPGAADPSYLTEAARHHLRDKFLAAGAGLTGVNFAVAETGAVVVCTNEGNADMGTSLPPLHIACMGLEKIIPRERDLGVFLRLLARSATGQPITTYTTHFFGPRAGGELHIVIVDNGRSQTLGREAVRDALACIRCGACMNTCPVYRRSGGHSYRYTVPGPIGSVLAPLRDPAAHASLAFASTLCGSCADVCPVRIDLHHQLLALRQDLGRSGHIAWHKRFLLGLLAVVFRWPALYRLSSYLARRLLPLVPRRLLYVRWNAWGRQRELPALPRHSFRAAYRRRRRDQS
ncbi:MAG TPA: LUD domain-containing protein [Kofleriaceae bacterium]|nr:LUD domain-containing protein [Kofleriaceae bacterium]